jgi:hypothetical protein
MTRIQRLENEFIERFKASGTPLTHVTEIALRHGFSSGAMAIQDIAYTNGRLDQQDKMKAAIGLFERSKP